MLFAEFYFRCENRTHRKISIRPIIIKINGTLKI